MFGIIKNRRTNCAPIKTVCLMRQHQNRPSQDIHIRGMNKMTDFIIQKLCVSCNESRDKNDFHKSRRAKDGHRIVCKYCVRKRQQQYEQALKEREAFSVLENKTCSKCNQTLCVSNFRFDKSKKSGYHSNCRSCELAQKQTPEFKAKRSIRLKKEWQEMSRLERYEIKLKQFYNLSLSDYQGLYAAQKGCCGICQKTFSEFAMFVDHDHESGKIRGLLCRTCNCAIGMLGDDLKGLMRAVDYLKR
jgi:Recombination endonuclease VII